MISSDDLMFFNVVANSASLAESARKLNVTAPAVTQRLRALEERVGIRLVDRSGRRLSLTDEGALVAAHGMAVVDAIEALTDALASRRNAVSGHLRIEKTRLRRGDNAQMAKVSFVDDLAAAPVAKAAAKPVAKTPAKKAPAAAKETKY